MTISKPEPKNNNLLRNSIITGIISSSAFTFFLQPLILWTWPLLKNSGLQIYTSFNDEIYKAAALGYRNDTERLTLAFYTAIFVTAIISLSVFFVVSVKGKESWSKFTESLDRVGSSKLRKIFWIGRILLVCYIILMIFFTARMYVSTMLVYASTELNASFQQRLNAIRPYLSDSDEDGLISSWALMKNEGDYTKLNKQMELVGDKNGIILPRTLWPDVLNNDYAWP